MSFSSWTWTDFDTVHNSLAKKLVSLQLFIYCSPPNHQCHACHQQLFTFSSLANHMSVTRYSLVTHFSLNCHSSFTLPLLTNYTHHSRAFLLPLSYRKENMTWWQGSWDSMPYSGPTSSKFLKPRVRLPPHFPSFPLPFPFFPLVTSLLCPSQVSLSPGFGAYLSTFISKSFFSICLRISAPTRGLEAEPVGLVLRRRRPRSCFVVSAWGM